jgi:hypothetical protein
MRGTLELEKRQSLPIQAGARRRLQAPGTDCRLGKFRSLWRRDPFTQAPILQQLLSAPWVPHFERST